MQSIENSVDKAFPIDTNINPLEASVIRRHIIVAHGFGPLFFCLRARSSRLFLSCLARWVLLDLFVIAFLPGLQGSFNTVSTDFTHLAKFSLLCLLMDVGEAVRGFHLLALVFFLTGL